MFIPGNQAYTTRLRSFADGEADHQNPAAERDIGSYFTATLAEKLRRWADGLYLRATDNLRSSPDPKKGSELVHTVHGTNLGNTAILEEHGIRF